MKDQIIFCGLMAILIMGVLLAWCVIAIEIVLFICGGSL